MKILILCIMNFIVFVQYALAVEYQQIENAADDQFEVIEISNLNQLRLFLKNPQTNQYYKSFDNIRHQLKSCEQLTFAMNAGMFHSNFSPVGLYIEQGNVIQALNEDKGWGNFFLQPNGVLAWNKRQAVIWTTEQYKAKAFQPDYATQSGPMLVMNGKINPLFLANSDSKKIRNGVGIKNNKLYFVISKNRVNFYNFAEFFQKNLKVEQALYLDGSISSLYLQKNNRNDRKFYMGPIIGLVSHAICAVK
ncbi:phosphodiester glycosidase family protein [Acinetobacter sp. V110_1]|uniref:phosphodiester glycosidase family protein n=1 Tax=unclassified Acinetobacter TaxID=196816 RepID=UPI00287C0AB1|nr:MULTISPECIES: phosphodiester glycosidase family protein [unclassified Acinetobacter]MDS7945026.1 phosphodiester glycosidase family protein [Acinetobacter sp. V110_1]MDS7968463.1 phosphodiester glycosidase family protein [Acinetobacter sp. V117_2]